MGHLRSAVVGLFLVLFCSTGVANGAEVDARKAALGNTNEKKNGLDLESLSTKLFGKFQAAKHRLSSLARADPEKKADSEDETEAENEEEKAKEKEEKEEEEEHEDEDQEASSSKESCARPPCSVAGVAHVHVFHISQPPPPPPTAAPVSMPQQLIFSRPAQVRFQPVGLTPLMNPYAVRQMQLQQQQQLAMRGSMLGFRGPNANTVPIGVQFNSHPVIPMGPLTAGFSAPALPGVSPQQETSSHGSAPGSRVSPDAAAVQAKTIAQLANLTQAVQEAQTNLTLATYRLQSAADDKQKRENAVLQKSIEVFKLKASMDAMKDRITAGAAEVSALKEGATKSAAKLLKVQKAQEKAKAAYMDAAEDLMDARMTAQQKGSARTAVGVDIGNVGTKVPGTGVTVGPE